MARENPQSNINIFSSLVDLAQKATNLTERQRTVLGVIAGLGGAAAIVAALRSERFRELLKDAGDATKKFTEDTGRDAWEVLKREVPELGDRAAKRFGEGVVNPFAGGIADELNREQPLSKAMGEGLNMLKGLLSEHPLARRMKPPQIKRVPIVDADKTPQN